MKTFKQVLSFVLAVAMCIGLLILPTVVSAAEGDTILMQQDWEGFEVGIKISTSTKDAAGNKPVVEIGPNNEIKSEERDGQPNKYIHLPFEGTCDVDSGSGNMSGNADKNFQVTHEEISYKTARYCVFENEFRWDTKDSKNARMQFQFRSCTATPEGGTGTKSYAWVDLFIVNLTKNQLYREGDIAIPTTGAVEPVPGEWNQFRIIFDLEDGFYDIYVNGILYSMHNALTRDGDHLTNIVITKNQMQCGKMMKAKLNTYSQDISGECAYVDMDNMVMYSTNMRQITVDGLPLLTAPGTLPLTLGGKTLLYTEYSYTKDNVKVTERTTADTFKLTADLLAAGDLVITRHFMDGASYGGDDFEWFTDDHAEDELSLDPHLLNIPNSPLFIGSEKLKDGEIEYENKFLQIPLIAGDSADGTGEVTVDETTYESIVDKNYNIKVASTSYEDVDDDADGNNVTSKYVAVSAKYLISDGAKVSVEALWENYTADGSEGTNGQFFFLRADGEQIYIDAPAGEKATAEELDLQYGEWIKIVAILDLVSGNVNVYANGKLAVVNSSFAADKKNFVLAEDGLVFAKINKLDAFDATNEGFVADSSVQVDDIQFIDGPKANFTVVLNEGDEQLPVQIKKTSYSKYIGETFDLTPEGYFFKTAKMMVTVEEEQEVQATDDSGEPLWEDPETKQIPVMTTEVVSVTKPVPLETPIIPVDFDLDGVEIVVYGAKNLFWEDYNAGSNPCYHVPFHTSNINKSLKVNHLAAANDAVISFKVSYFPHYAMGTNPTFEALLDGFDFKSGDQEYSEGTLSLYKINLQTGKITLDCGTVEDEEAAMKMDEWNLVEVIFNTKEGSYELYLNGDLYAKAENLTCDYYTDDYYTADNCTDFKIGINKFIVGKCLKQADAYAEADDETVNYIDIDDVIIAEIGDTGAIINTLAVIDFNTDAPEKFSDSFPVATYKAPAVDTSVFEEFIGEIVYEDENGFISIPATAANNGKSLLYPNQTISSENFNAKVVIEASYRFNKTGAAKLAATVNADETLFTLDASNGNIEGTNLTLVPGEWFNVKAIFDLEVGTFEVFVNNELTKTGEVTAINEKSIVFALITAEADTEVVFDVDNTVIRYQEQLTVVIDGKETQIAENEFYTLGSRTAKFLYAKVEIPAGVNETGETVYDTVFVYDPVVRVVTEGTKYTAYTLSKFAAVKAADGGALVRLGTPTGLRFLTDVISSELNAFAGDVAAIKVGTIIASYDNVAKAADFTAEALGEGNYIDVEVELNQYYATRDSATGLRAFAGSISNVKEANLTKKYIARGYFTVTIHDGDAPITIYADMEMDNLEAYACSLAQAAKNALDGATGYTDNKSKTALKNTAVKAMVQAYADKLSEN